MPSSEYYTGKNAKYMGIYSNLIDGVESKEQQAIALLKDYASGFNAFFFHPRRSYKSVVARLITEYDDQKISFNDLFNTHISYLVNKDGKKENSSLARRFHFIKNVKDPLDESVIANIVKEDSIFSIKY